MEKRRKMTFRLSEKASDALRILQTCEGKRIPVHIAVKALIEGIHPHDLYRALAFSSDAFGKLFLKASEQSDKRYSQKRHHVTVEFFDSDIERMKNVQQALFTLDWAKEPKTPRVLTANKVINRLLIMAVYDPEGFKEFSGQVKPITMPGKARSKVSGGELPA
jgi:hypothetical protein